MNKLDDHAKRVGIKMGCIALGVYLFIVTIILASVRQASVCFAYIGAPLVFWLFYTFTYSLSEGFIKFLSYSRMMTAYDNRVDNYMKSEFSKHVGAITMPIICFVPTLIFFILFAWIFYLCKI